MKNRFTLILIVSIIFFVASCAVNVKYGGIAKLETSQLKAPVSMNEYIHINNDELGYYRSETNKYKLEKVGELNLTIRKNIPNAGLNDTIMIDLSNEIEREIKKYNGDGVVNFEIIKATSYFPNVTSDNFATLYFLSVIGGSALILSKENRLPGYFLVGTGASLLTLLIMEKLPSNIEIQLKGDIVKFKH